MRREFITTPFGRRSMSLGMLANQHLASQIEPGMRRNKWKLFRSVCEARRALGISDRSLTVLDALLTFYPEDELNQDSSLVVFPSNAQLSLRARGMTPATLRRHLSLLIEAGLIFRKDSPNGKRYARRARSGQISEAFGFSLAPMLARACEIDGLAAETIIDRETLRAIKEQISICRRDVSKLLATAIAEALPGNWNDVLMEFRAITSQIPRNATLHDLLPIRQRMIELHDLIVNELKSQVKLRNLSGNESQDERHKQDSKPNFLSDSEPLYIRDHFPASDPTDQHIENIQQMRNNAENTIIHTPSPERITLELVLQACPQIIDYAPARAVRTWRDLASAAMVVRSMLDVSTTAYGKACAVMGMETTAIVMACILERATSINSPGGYLRDLTKRCERREFVPNGMLMAVLRAHTRPRIPSSETERSVSFHKEKSSQGKQYVTVSPA
ncbi:plasmid replication protein RepC [Neorhizobium alkalisoli]|uniref:plasmid replication protein RepC n=1 Tax=Neorhizobium alkalisoli TaxID=528178 RepID=UPI000CFA10D6|nr:plasmid replication protein RepC [Neorhizobium alkalisoli]